MSNLVENHHIVQALWSAVNTSSGSLENVAPLVRKLLDTGAWKKREVPQLGRVVEFKRFLDFVINPPLEGCGWPPAKVEALIKDDPETLALWRDATKAQGARHDLRRNTTKVARDDRGKAYTLARLKRERSDLFKRVVAGDLSAHAAAKKAGWRKTLTAFDRAIAAFGKLNEAERRRFFEAINRKDRAA